MTEDREKNQEEISPLTSGRQSIDTFGYLIFFVVVIEIALIFGLNLYQKSRIETLNNELIQKKQLLSSEAYKTLNTQVDEVIEGRDTLKTVLNSKVKWASFYGMLNSVTPKDVSLVEISVSDSGAFSASGQTTSLSSLAKAIIAWQAGTATTPTPFSSVSLNSNGYFSKNGQRQVSFSVSGSINMGLIK